MTSIFLSHENKTHQNLNNQVRKFDRNSDTFLTKHFDINRSGSEERFRRETRFYEYCNLNKIDSVPRLLEIREDTLEFDLSFFDGNSLAHGSQKDLDNFVQFVSSLNVSGSLAKSANDLPFAAESFFTKDELLGCLNTRINRLNLARIADFLPEKRFRRLREKSEHMLRNSEFDIGIQVVNPSDLGLHNYIINRNAHCFVDFEYSGRDSSIKLLYDFALHPKNSFESVDVKGKFNSMAEALPKSVTFDNRMAQVFCFWWILRLIESLTSESSFNKLKFRNFTPEQRNTFISERIANLRLFDGYFDEFA